MSALCRKVFFVVLLALGFFPSCSTNANRPFTEEQIIQIYVATEFSSASDADKVVTQYGLANDAKRHAYYRVVRDLTDTPEKYDTFLEKVELYKQNRIAESTDS